MAMHRQKYQLDSGQMLARECHHCGIMSPGQRLSAEAWLTEAMFNDAGV